MAYNPTQTFRSCTELNTFIDRFVGRTCQLHGCPLTLLHPQKSRLVVAGDDALLVVAGGLIVGINDGVRGHTVGVVRLSPGVDGVDVRNVLEHGGAEKGEHFCSTKVHVRESRGKNYSMKENNRSESKMNSMLQKDSEGQEGIERQEVERESERAEKNEQKEGVSFARNLLWC